MSELLKRLRGQGELEYKGEFSLDVEQAQRKMSHFQLRHAHDFLYHMAAGLFRLGAARLHVFRQGARLILEMPGLSLPANLLENLPLAIFEESSGYRRLAAAAQSLLAFELVRFDWLGAQPEQHYDYLSQKGQKWQNVSLLQVQIEGVPAGVVEAALAELSRRASWSRRPVQVGERRFQRPQGPESRLGGFPCEYEWSPGEKPRLVLVMDEMATEIRVVEAPFAWTGVCYGQFRLDASLAQVVEDDAFLKMLEDIPTTFADCVRSGLRSVPPAEIFGLLLAPLPSWLWPLQEQLYGLPLFHDQRKRVWCMAELAKATEPVYYAEESAELQQLEPTILVRLLPPALECLRSQLGARLEHADQLVVRKLQREHNRRVWQQQSVLPLALSRRHWIARREFAHERARWWVGIPDDWSQSGTTVTLWVEGRKLSECKLILQEFACEIACEVAADQVNELWTGLDNRAWSELEPRWSESIQEVLRALSDEEMQPSLRHSLKRHLATAPRPEFSYFHKTLLFQDWHGQFYSLDQLLSVGQERLLGVVASRYRPEDFVSALIPDGIYLRDSGFEMTILKKQRLLNCIVLDHLLEDFLEAKRQAFVSDSLMPKPEFGTATVWLCADGVCLAPFTVDTPLAFEARVCAQNIEVKTILYNDGLGPSRFKPVQNEATARIVASLQERLPAVLERRLQRSLDATWLAWLQQACLRGLAQGFLAEAECWPCFGRGRVSLRQLREARVVYWCSAEPSVESARQLDGEILLCLFSSLLEPELRAAAGHNEWICLDETFARENEQAEFLRRPLWRASFPDSVAPPKPDLWLVNGYGCIYWLFHGRLVEEERGALPFGFRVAVECPSLLPEEWPRQDLLSKCHAYLREWLAVARPSLWEHWRRWSSLELPDGVLQALRGQPWFSTSRGMRSWNELMEEPEIWLDTEPGRAFPPHLIIVYDPGPAPQTAELIARHARGHGVDDTAAELKAHAAQESQRQLILQKSRRLQGLRHRVKTSLGEVALSGKNTKDVWLLGERQVLIMNLPAGLAGFVVGEELSQESREELLDRVADLLVARVAEGPLNASELELVAEVCSLVPRLDSLRWIECADGSYASLQQLRHEAEERQEVLYWPRDFRWRMGGPALLPILSSPLLLEVVERACQAPLRLCPPPLLYREIPLPTLRGVREVLSALAHTELPLLAGIRKMLAGPPTPVEDPEVGRVLMLSLRRRASQLLSGTARTVCLHHLEHARLRPGQERLWQFQGELVLCADHPVLLPWLGAEEPPLSVQTSLLLSLVCACNAMSQPFTDQMERDFLEQLARDMVESLPRS